MLWQAGGVCWCIFHHPQMIAFALCQQRQQPWSQTWAAKPGQQNQVKAVKLLTILALKKRKTACSILHCRFVPGKLPQQLMRGTKDAACMHMCKF